MPFSAHTKPVVSLMRGVKADARAASPPDEKMMPKGNRRLAFASTSVTPFNYCGVPPLQNCATLLQWLYLSPTLWFSCSFNEGEEGEGGIRLHAHALRPILRPSSLPRALSLNVTNA